MLTHIDYYHSHKFSTDLCGQAIQYYSKPGLPEWNEIPASIHLLAYYAKPDPDALVWCINCGSGSLEAYIGKSQIFKQCIISAPDVLTLLCAKQTLAENGLGNITIDSKINLPCQMEDKVDLVLLKIGKGRNLNRRWLIQAWTGLKMGGHLLISGANNMGIQSVIKDAAQVFNNSKILGYKKGNRIAKFVKLSTQPPISTWCYEPGIKPGTWHTIHVRLPEYEYDIVSLPGIFSYSGIDEGTQMLISTISDLKGHTVLDVGCGYGILGLFTATQGAQAVDMVDSQFLSIESAIENIHRNNTSQCNVIPSDLLSAVAPKKYSFILSNPPFHAGKQVNYQIAHAMINSAYALLDKGGVFRLVSNRFIRYDYLMSDTFSNVSITTQNSAYQVLSSLKK